MAPDFFTGVIRRTTCVSDASKGQFAVRNIALGTCLAPDRASSRRVLQSNWQLAVGRFVGRTAILTHQMNIVC